MSMDDSVAKSLNVALFVRNVVVRGGLGALARQLAIVGSIHECAHEHEVGELVAGGDVDVVIVTTAESEVAGQLVQPESATKVLVVLDQSEASNPEMVTNLFADGFQVQQELTASNLGKALLRIVGGEMSMPARLGQQLLSRAGTSKPNGWPRPVALTPRESETLQLLAEGLSNKQMARRLSISDHGAKRLVTSVMLKLGASNRTAAVVVGIRAGMIPLSRDGHGVDF
jgi:two-component system, NarL family, nitrate/nitrite response regulator NarL